VVSVPVPLEALEVAGADHGMEAAEKCDLVVGVVGWKLEGEVVEGQ
jgi:hypothetical protein